VGVDALQKVFKTFSDPTRVRILALLEREELAVQEIMEVLGMAQSRVSRHLAILREAGLLRDRRDGTFVIYTLAPPREPPWREAWELTREALRDDPAAARDAAALDRVMSARAARTRRFFEAVGPEWDALRKVFNDDALRARAVSHLVDPGLRVADVGTGTGILAVELAQLGLRVVAVDNAERMLEATRAKVESLGLSGIELRAGDARALPLEDGEVDAALAHMVLHYLPSPPDAVREMARVVRPGGTVVLADFVKHEHEWMREELGVAWLGFAREEVEGWLREAGLAEPALDVYAGYTGARDLPATFLAWARRPRQDG